MPLDTVQTALGIAATLLGGVVAVVAFLWRISGRFHELTSTQSAVTLELGKLRGHMSLTGKRVLDALEVMGRRIGELEKAQAVLASTLGEREKDIARLEGKLEQAHDDTLRVVSSLSQVMSSSDKVWRTLEKLHPDEVPRRVSDRR